jgi:hypothetical protein
LNKLTLAYASPLELLPSAPHQPTVVARSSNQAWPHLPESNIHPEYVPGPTFFERYDLGLYFYGTYQSKWEPSARSADKVSYAVLSGSHTLVQSSGVGSRAFFVNCVSYMTRDLALAGIDRQENAFRTIQTPGEAGKQQLRWLSTIIPLSLIGLTWFAVALGYRQRHFDI